MKLATLRLTLAVVLFATWIGWLVYLVYSMKASLPPGATRPVVLSRPQFLVSSLDVIAFVPSIEIDPVGVTIREVAWPQTTAAQELVGKDIEISRLPDCREDWIGPGEYILALEPSGDKHYQVVPLPRSPGFPSGRPRIYPSTPQTRTQLPEIRKSAAILVLVQATSHSKRGERRGVSRRKPAGARAYRRTHAAPLANCSADPALVPE
jgi:hypothetical protein